MSALFQTTFALVAVLLAIWGCAYLLRKLQAVRGGHSNLIQLKAISSLGPREKVALIEVSGQLILVGVAAGQVNHIATLERSTDIDNTPDVASTPIPFNAKSWLDTYLKNHNAK
jgi:flagellar protein FliO/FliZ